MESMIKLNLSELLTQVSIVYVGMHHALEGAIRVHPSHPVFYKEKWFRKSLETMAKDAHANLS
jgi:hypothetical protein